MSKTKKEQSERVATLYPKVLSMVKSGVVIYKALYALGIDSSTFYAHITKEQKLELGYNRTTTKTFSAKGTSGGSRSKTPWGEINKGFMHIHQEEEEEL